MEAAVYGKGGLTPVAAGAADPCGDTVATEPNEKHWHGACRSGPFAHVVVNIGETRWLEESPAPPELWKRNL